MSPDGSSLALPALQKTTSRYGSGICFAAGYPVMA
jgi:hypothetical protein